MLSFITACSSSDNDIINDNEGENEVVTADTTFSELTDLNFNLSENEDTAVISVNEDGWHIEGIKTKDVNGEVTYSLSEAEKAKLISEGLYEGTFSYWLSIKCTDKKIYIYVQFSREEARSFSFKLVKGAKAVTVCGSQPDVLTGKWPDIIKAMPRNIVFNADKDTAFVSTEIDNYRIPQITIDGKTYSIPLSEESNKIGFTKKIDWLTVKHSEKGVMVVADKNDGVQRSFSFNLTYGDLANLIEGVQKGAKGKE